MGLEEDHVGDGLRALVRDLVVLGHAPVRRRVTLVPYVQPGPVRLEERLL